jgi:CRISPR-associated Cas5-like protein
VVALKHLVPHAVRRGISAQLSRVQAARLERGLANLAAGSGTIVAGPWLGEVGFELLYWVPFLRWFADRYHIAPERLLIVSRGGTASWYRPFASGYRETFDYLTPEEFRRRHDERVSANGEQKQTQVLAFERELLRELTTDVHDRSMLHPSSMYALFNPFWWRHVDESWVHEHAAYARLAADAAAPFTPPDRPYTAAKFYFNDCFPPTDANRAFVRRTLQALAERGPVVSLATGLRLDDHDGDDLQALGVLSLPRHLEPRDNLAAQTAAVAGACAFVGTYGGFSYLAPFLGVRTTAYYANHGFSQRHLTMARSAFASLGVSDLFEVSPLA